MENTWHECVTSFHWRNKKRFRHRTANEQAHSEYLYEKHTGFLGRAHVRTSCISSPVLFSSFYQIWNIPLTCASIRIFFHVLCISALCVIRKNASRFYPQSSFHVAGNEHIICRRLLAFIRTNDIRAARAMKMLHGRRVILAIRNDGSFSELAEVALSSSERTSDTKNGRKAKRRA